MKTAYYLLLTGLGILLSIPMTVIIIAYQTANNEVDKIKKRFEEIQKANKK